MTADPAGLNDHYGSEDLAGRIRAALGPNPVTRADLENLDEFHTRGIQATREIATLAGLDPGMRVLDLGCGLGGPARTIADEFGCEVDGVEIVKEFCRAATMLNEMTGLADRVTIREADMRPLPFDDGVFDRAMALHVLVNVPDKIGMAVEIKRVIKPGAKFCLYEVCSGNGGPLEYPVPWASGPALDHVETEESLKADIEAAGFKIENWEDVSARVLDWFDGLASRFEEGAPRRHTGPTLGLVMGPDAAAKSMNLRRNLQEGRIQVVMGVAGT